MASTEYLCSDISCKFHDFSNDPLTVCPLCAKAVVAFTDEADDSEVIASDFNEEGVQDGDFLE